MKLAVNKEKLAYQLPIAIGIIGLAYGLSTKRKVSRLGDGEKRKRYVVVGAIGKELAKRIGKPEGEIVLTYDRMQHIKERHSPKGRVLTNITIIKFVERTISQANETFVGNNGNILFATSGGEYVKIAVVSSHKNVNRRYSVVTAFTGDEEYLQSRKSKQK
jgi:hypothetical protein